MIGLVSSGPLAESGLGQRMVPGLLVERFLGSASYFNRSSMSSIISFRL